MSPDCSAIGPVSRLACMRGDPPMGWPGADAARAAAAAPAAAEGESADASPACHVLPVAQSLTLKGGTCFPLSTPVPAKSCQSHCPSLRPKGSVIAMLLHVRTFGRKNGRLGKLMLSQEWQCSCRLQRPKAQHITLEVNAALVALEHVQAKKKLHVVRLQHCDRNGQVVGVYLGRHLYVCKPAQICTRHQCNCERLLILDGSTVLDEVPNPSTARVARVSTLHELLPYESARAAPAPVLRKAYVGLTPDRPQTFRYHHCCASAAFYLPYPA